jgi:hypothetical protein
MKMTNRRVLSAALCFALTFSTTAIASVGRPGRNYPGAGLAKLTTEGIQESIDHDWPPNIFLPREMIPFVRLILKRSSTFRQQLEQINRARHIRIRVSYISPPPPCGCRALSQIKKYDHGFRDVRVYVFAPGILDPEIIAHEFEHALEQAEGLDLSVLAKTKGSGVYLRANDSFETRRAQRAGRQVDAEFISFRESKLRE